MKRLIAFLTLMLGSAALSAQISVVIPSSGTNTGPTRVGENLGGVRPFGSQDILANLGWSDGSWMPDGAWRTTFQCNGTSSTTVWPTNNIQASLGYPAGWFNGGTLEGFNAATTPTAANYGTSTITASTSNATAGIQFTLSPPQSSACSVANHDVAIVRQNGGNTQFTPFMLAFAAGGGMPTNAVWNTTDLDPGVTTGNTTHVLELPTGGTVTYGLDQKLANATNSNSTLAAVQVPWIELNGTYQVPVYAKCNTGSTGNIQVNVFRSGQTTPTVVPTTTYVNGVNIPLTCNPTAGAGWVHTNSISFAANETGNGQQVDSLTFQLVTTGDVEISYADIIEGHTLSYNAGGHFRDAVVEELVNDQVADIRTMDPADWGGSATNLNQVPGNVQWTGVSPFLPYANGALLPTLPYVWRLELARIVSQQVIGGTDLWITLPNTTSASEMTALINWLPTNSDYAALCAGGNKVHLEYINEPWNSQAGGYIGQGSGTVYGTQLGLAAHAAHTASGWNSACMSIVGAQQYAPNQSTSNFGWTHIMMTAAAAAGDKPDEVDLGPYIWGMFQTATISGGSLVPTADPYPAQFTEPYNINSVASPPANTPSVKLSTAYAQTTFGVPTGGYEENVANQIGNGFTQGEVNQADRSVSASIAETDNWLLSRRDGGMTGQINIFALTENFNGYTCRTYSTQTNVPTVTTGTASGLTINITASGGLITAGTLGSGTPTGYTNGQIVYPAQSGATSATFSVQVTGSTITGVTLVSAGMPCINGVVFPGWGGAVALQPGPGNLSTTPNYVGPLQLAMRVANTAIGAKTNKLPLTVSGAGTYAYAGGQNDGAGIQILPNSAVPLQDIFGFNDNSNNYALIVVNKNLTAAATLNLSGAGAPTGSITQTVFPGGSNNLTSNCEDQYLGASSIACTVIPPTPSSVSGTSVTCPAASLCSWVYSAGTPTLTPPTFSPVAGTYSTSQSVTITGPSGATFCYTTDGSTPTASPVGACTHGTTYTSPVTVSSNLTINAIATEVGFFNSSVASAAYVIAPPAATPTFSPVAGTYTSVQTVTISTTTPSPTIHYTTDGSTPTLASPTYTGPITVATSQTVNAIAIASGFSISPVGTAVYVINLPTASAPTFSPVAGTYATAQSVTLSTTTSSGVICYKIGSAPSASTPGTCDAGSTTYSTAISVSTSQTIFALTTKVGLTNSSVAQAAYVIEVPAATPTFSPVAGTYTSPQSVTILDTTPSSSIFYTINGTTPTPSSTPYTGPIAVNVTTTINAIVTAPGFLNSAVGTAVYTLNLPVAPTPTFVPAGGTYTSVQSVTIATTLLGASLFYTTDGSTPTPSSTLYTGPISVGTTQTVKAIATKVGFTNSAVGSATYTINLPAVATPTFTPPAGTYSSPQSVAISSTTAGASIYYTTNGSTPTPSSTLYTGPITVSASQTVKAIGVLIGFSNSAVGSAAYTITSTTQGCTVRGTVTIRGTFTVKCPQ